MDQTSQPVEQQSPLPVNRSKNKVGFEILFIGIVIIFLTGILNYFNILPLSSLFPNYLGFLPHQQSKQESNVTIQQFNNVSPTNNVTPALRTKFSCPSVKEFCENAQAVIKDQKYVGLGYKLSSGSAIFAAFDGDLTATFSAYPIEVNAKTTQEKFKTLYLDSPNLDIRGVYYFRGQVTKTGPVIKGEQVAISNGRPIEAYDNNSLIFSLIPGYPALNTPTILNKEVFE